MFLNTPDNEHMNTDYTVSTFLTAARAASFAAAARALLRFVFAFALAFSSSPFLVASFPERLPMARASSGNVQLAAQHVAEQVAEALLPV